MKTRALFFFMLLVRAFAPRLLADDTPGPFTLDLPAASTAALPSWLGHPLVTTAPFAAFDLPVTPPEAGDALLVTVFFQEQDGGFLRISWQAAAAVATPGENSASGLPGPGEASQSAVLTDNFYEGIGMANQRSLLVSADAMKTPGGLHFQTGNAALGISRIRLEWLKGSAGLSSPAITDTLVTPAHGTTQPASSLAGLPATEQDPAWHDRVVDVPLTDTPVRIEQGVDFTVQIATAPALARISLKEAGLPPGRHLAVWLNGQHAGEVATSVPDLGDGGYGTNAASSYVGWREGTFLVPVSALSVGANTIQFAAESDDPAATDAGSPTPLALKDVVMQLAYPPRPAAAGNPPSDSSFPAPSASTSTPAPTPPDNADANRLTPMNSPGLGLLRVPSASSSVASSPDTTTP